jgi:hypothetical protein
MIRRLAFTAAILLISLQAQSAAAATSIQTYHFLANTEGPISTFAGTAKLAIDDEDSSSRVLAFDLEAPSQGFTVVNTMLTTVFGGRIIVLQSIVGGVLGPWKGVDGFVLSFDREDLNKGIFGYTLASEPANEEGHGYRAVAIDIVADAVPEPATWAMMMLGFVAVGAALRRQGPRAALVSGSPTAHRSRTSPGVRQEYGRRGE